MNHALISLVIALLLMLFVVAPFAGLAPLMVMIFIAALAWSIKLFLQVLWAGNPQEDSKS